MADTSVSYKCPNCGAPLTFIPGKKNVSCEYCHGNHNDRNGDFIYFR